MMDNRKPKKITQKDRYGNQVSVEYTDEQKPFDINAVLEKLLDRDVPEMLTIPESSPIGGGVSIGFADAHPGDPRGSDTVPAWLTPGEFVVNKEAMDDPQNAQAVRAINEQGRKVQQMKHGGPLQMHRMPGGVAMGGAALRVCGTTHGDTPRHTMHLQRTTMFHLLNLTALLIDSLDSLSILRIIHSFLVNHEFTWGQPCWNCIGSLWLPWVCISKPNGHTTTNG